MYLYFVLISELKHLSLLSQYYRPLGSWSALLHFFWISYQKKIEHESVNFNLDFDSVVASGHLNFLCPKFCFGGWGGNGYKIIF